MPSTNRGRNRYRRQHRQKTTCGIFKYSRTDPRAEKAEIKLRLVRIRTAVGAVVSKPGQRNPVLQTGACEA